MDYDHLLSYAQRGGSSSNPRRSVAMESGKIRGSMESKVGNVPKKVSTKGPDPLAVLKFKQMKEREEQRRMEEERRRKEKLLYLRAQNSKNSKAAKMMASRTKDNDFSKIVLTEEERVEKNAIEEKLRQQRISDPRERMKHRIELENEAQDSPKKRKRKVAVDDYNHDPVDYSKINSNPHQYIDDRFVSKKGKETKHENSKAKTKTAPPPLNFNDLLKIAEKKQKEEPKPSLLDEIEIEKDLRKNEFRRVNLSQLKRVKEDQTRKDASSASDKNRSPPAPPVRKEIKTSEENKTRIENGPVKTMENGKRTNGISHASSSKNSPDPKPRTQLSLNSRTLVSNNSDAHRQDYKAVKKKESFGADHQQCSSKNESYSRHLQDQGLPSTSSSRSHHISEKEISSPRDSHVRGNKLNPTANNSHSPSVLRNDIRTQAEIQRSKASEASRRKEEYRPTKVYHKEQLKSVPDHKQSQSSRDYSREELVSKKRRLVDCETFEKQQYVPTKVAREAEYKLKPRPSLESPSYKPSKKVVHHEEYSPPRFTKEKPVVKKRRTEEYSPSEPYINSKTKSSSASASGKILKYQPTSRKETLHENVNHRSQPDTRHERERIPSHHRPEIRNEPKSYRTLPERDERVDKQKSKRLQVENSKSSKNLSSVNNVLSKSRLPPRRPNLPPIGLNYKRGMYDTYENYEVSEEEEDEDDEMRDFIDDGDDYVMEKEDYSEYIREIFGYDRRKYAFESEDEVEESSFAQQMNEEMRSAKIGYLEDLEDMRKEEEEKRRKALKKKSRRIIDDDDESE